MEETREDPGILCFQHCDKSVQVFCFELPRYCDVCGGDLYVSELRIPPFRLPYPFVKAARSPCSLLIRPTLGDFLHHYQNAADLHIGVTDSRGVVFEYDQGGLRCNDRLSSWDQSLAIDITTRLGHHWTPRLWDHKLDTIAAQLNTWSPLSYHVDDHNCYSFVLEFLQLLHLKFNKMEFCQQFILPKTVSAGKYISLYRKLMKENIVIKKISN